MGLRMVRVFCILFCMVIGCQFCTQAIAQTLDYAHGKFERLRGSKYEIYGSPPLKLPNNKILIMGLRDTFVFDPATNKFRKTANLPAPLAYVMNDDTEYSAIVLKNGKVLCFGEYLEQPSWKFRPEIQAAYMQQVTNEALKEDPNFLLKSLDEKEKLRDSKWQEYMELYEEGKAKIYIPIIKKDSNLLKRYNAYCERRLKSMHAFIYDPETGISEYTGKPNFSDKYPDFYAKMILKKDGKVLLFWEEGEVEEYNPDTGKFTILNVLKPASLVKRAFLLDNNKIFLHLSGNRYCYYNIENNSFSEIKTFPYEGYRAKKTWQLNSHLILLLAQNGDEQSFFVFDTEKNVILKKIKLLINHDSYFLSDLQLVVLPEEQVLVIGGYLDTGDPLTGYSDTARKTEYYDFRTGEARFVRTSKYPHRSGYDMVLLRDGRILVYDSKDNEIYVPKKIKK